MLRTRPLHHDRESCRVGQAGRRSAAHACAASALKAPRGTLHEPGVHDHVAVHGRGGLGVRERTGPSPSAGRAGRAALVTGGRVPGPALLRRRWRVCPSTVVAPIVHSAQERTRLHRAPDRTSTTRTIASTATPRTAEQRRGRRTLSLRAEACARTVNVPMPAIFGGTAVNVKPSRGRDSSVGEVLHDRDAGAEEGGVHRAALCRRARRWRRCSASRCRPLRRPRRPGARRRRRTGTGGPSRYAGVPKWRLWPGEEQHGPTVDSTRRRARRRR